MVIVLENVILVLKYIGWIILSCFVVVFVFVIFLFLVKFIKFSCKRCKMLS